MPEKRTYLLPVRGEDEAVLVLQALESEVLECVQGVQDCASSLESKWVRDPDLRFSLERGIEYWDGRYQRLMVLVQRARLHLAP